MGAEGLGRWEPLPVSEAVDLFSQATFRWWLSGGHALEAHFADSWRTHDDTDIGIVRADAPQLHKFLRGWDIHIGAAGVLTPWLGEPLDPDRSENNLWCRPSPEMPWALDVTIGDGDEDDWIYRRDTTVRRKWSDAVLTTADGLPYLAPELQLLFKSKTIRPKDQLDATVIIPRLDQTRRSWLRDQLPIDHPWRALTSEGSKP